MIRNHKNVRPYVTKDGSLIRELFHPSSSDIEGFSIAEADVRQGQETDAHLHKTSQEVYYILRGSVAMRLGNEILEVKEGDAVIILPGMVHSIRNTGKKSMRILCVCSPAYEHNDTNLL
jgi:mannose-6-phosphate isomerase-like protein (cupin superfamily)